MMDIPVGVGVAYRMAGFVAEARGTFRPTTGSSLVLENQSNGTSAEIDHLSSWDANINVGYEW